MPELNDEQRDRLEYLFDASVPGPDIDLTTHPEKAAAKPVCFSSGDIARTLRQPFWRVCYYLRVLDLKPVATVGIVRIFDEAAVNRVRRQIELADAKQGR